LDNIALKPEILQLFYFAGARISRAPAIENTGLVKRISSVWRSDLGFSLN
jgi:hypothetical protein